MANPPARQRYAALFTAPARNARRVSGGGPAAGADAPEPSWKAAFSVPFEPEALRDVLDRLSARELLQMRTQSQQFVIQAITAVEEHQSGDAGLPETAAAANALDALTVFLAITTTKQFDSPSSDLIAVYAGISNIDQVFSRLFDALERTIYNGRDVALTLKAVRVLLTIVTGANRTSLMTYFFRKDYFQCLMRAILTAEQPSDAVEAIALLGVLSSHSKFEGPNLYLSRMGDYVNEDAIQKIISAVDHVLESLRDEFAAVKEDVTDGWQLSNLLFFVRGRRKNLSVDEKSATAFLKLPGPGAAVLSAAYEFSARNRLFRTLFVSRASPEGERTSAVTPPSSPFGNFLSFTSYLVQQGRSQRGVCYSFLCLFILHFITEDEDLLQFCARPQNAVPVRMCRQKMPFLPLVQQPRILMSSMVDVLADGISQQFKAAWSMPLLVLQLTTTLRLFSTLFQTGRVALPAPTDESSRVHWTGLWDALFRAARFVPRFSTGADGAADLLIWIVSYVLVTAGAGDDTGLVPADALDDLVYKLLLLTGDGGLLRLRDASSAGSGHGLAAPSTPSALSASGSFGAAAGAAASSSAWAHLLSAPQPYSGAMSQGHYAVLEDASEYFHGLLQAEAAAGRGAAAAAGDEDGLAAAVAAFNEDEIRAIIRKGQAGWQAGTGRERARARLGKDGWLLNQFRETEWQRVIKSAVGVVPEDGYTVARARAGI